MSAESHPGSVLVIDDQVHEIDWLIDRLKDRGYEIVLVTNEADGRDMLDAVKGEQRAFAAGIFDVMMSTKDVWPLIEAGQSPDDQFYDDSKDSGLRLCRYARQELGLSAEELPIACLTVRDDEALKKVLRELGIPLYPRLDPGNQGVMEFIEEFLPY